MENTLHFLGGILVGVVLFMLITTFEHALRSQPDVPPGAIVITRADGVRCVGHIAARSEHVGVPPRLWICGSDEPPYYDGTGTKIPTHTLGELP